MFGMKGLWTVHFRIVRWSLHWVVVLDWVGERIGLDVACKVLFRAGDLGSIKRAGVLTLIVGLGSDDIFGKLDCWENPEFKVIKGSEKTLVSWWFNGRMARSAGEASLCNDIVSLQEDCGWNRACMGLMLTVDDKMDLATHHRLIWLMLGCINGIILLVDGLGCRAMMVAANKERSPQFNHTESAGWNSWDVKIDE